MFKKMISEEGLEQFIDLYEKKYSVRLSKQEAFDMFLELINTVRFGNSPDSE